jgi:hypothetical protein
MNPTLNAAAPAPRRFRYRNYFRWLILPPEGAAEFGLYDRSFETKKAALAYQKKVKAKFPQEPCGLIDTGQWHDYLGRIIR